MRPLFCVVVIFLVLSCEPRIVLHRLDYDAFKPNMYGLRYYVKDTSLVRFLGTWEGDDMQITFSKIAKEKDLDGQYINELINGIITVNQKNSDSERSTIVLPIQGGVFQRYDLWLHGTEHYFNASLQIDSLTYNELIWKRRSTLRTVTRKKNGKKKYIYDRKEIEGIDLPKELRLKRVR